MMFLFNLQCIFIDLCKFILQVSASLMHPRKIRNSYLFYKKLKASKKSENLLILSGYLTLDELEFPSEFDIFTNSSGTKYLDKVPEGNYILHYMAPHHSPISEVEYRKRIDDTKANFNPGFMVASFDGEEVMTFSSVYRYLKVWPFLKPYNGPAFLLWLAYKLGYQNIFLVGMRGTQMCGAKMASTGVEKYYDTSIQYLSLSTARMMNEFDCIFDHLQLNGVHVHQLDHESWIQPKRADRVVLQIDDSWKGGEK